MSILAIFRKTARRSVAGGEYGLDPGGRTGATQKLAALPCRRWSKWVVLAFWVVAFAVAGPLAGKLNSAQKNDASAWLP